MCIVGVARNHVPMQMWRQVAKAGKIDFLWLQHAAHGLLDTPYDSHEQCAIGKSQVGHFTRMAIEDHAQEARVVRLVHADDAAQVILPDDRPSGRLAEFAILAHALPRLSADEHE